MSKRVKVFGKLTDVHFVEMRGTSCCMQGRRNETLSVPALPGGFLRGEFKFQSMCQDGEPRFDLVWKVTGDHEEFSAGIALHRYRYIRVKHFDPASGDGVATIDIPLLGNNMGFPPLYPGKNVVTAAIGLEGESCYKQEDPFDGTEHTFDPIELTGLVPEYSVNVMLPDLDLQDRFESPIVVFAKKMSDKDRVVHLSLEYQPQDPCGVEYPDTITIPAGKMFAEGMLRFSSTSCGNNHASGVLQGHIGGVSYPSGPIEFSNLIMLPEGAIYSPFLASLNTWSYCERKARPDNRVLPARFTEGPCETSGLVFHVCKGPGVGFYFPHKCSFSFTTDCRIVQTNLQVPTYQLQRTFITGCQTMKFIADKPLHQGGGWQIVKGFKRVCVYTPAGRNGNITVDDCVTV